MTKKKLSHAQVEQEERDRIKRLVIISMFTDNDLMDKFVLKGGNALDLIHKISNRASVDVDLSMSNDFSADEYGALRGKIEKSLTETFQPEGYVVFDVKVEVRPSQLSNDIESFWGGYGVEFKLIRRSEYEAHRHDIETLRKYALVLGQGTRFTVDISKHEYTATKARANLDGIAVFVYTHEMIVCEKLRALCQQMPEYAPIVKRHGRAGSSRARDFVDIYTVVEAKQLDLTLPRNRDLLTHIFTAKRVALSLLRKVGSYREFHRTSFDAVRASIRPNTTLHDFDFYVDYAVKLIESLEPLGDE